MRNIFISQLESVLVVQGELKKIQSSLYYKVHGDKNSISEHKTSMYASIVVRATTAM